MLSECEHLIEFVFHDLLFLIALTSHSLFSHLSLSLHVLSKVSITVVLCYMDIFTYNDINNTLRYNT